MSIATDVEIRPLSGSIGAEVRGVDVSRDLDDDVVASIRAAWRRCTTGSTTAEPPTG